MPMTGLELRISGVGSDRSTNRATTTAYSDSCLIVFSFQLAEPGPAVAARVDDRARGRVHHHAAVEAGHRRRSGFEVAGRGGRRILGRKQPGHDPGHPIEGPRDFRRLCQAVQVRYFAAQVVESFEGPGFDYLLFLSKTTLSIWFRS